MRLHFPEVNFSPYDEIKRVLKYSRGWHGVPHQHPEHTAASGRGWLGDPGAAANRSRVPSSRDSDDGTHDLCGGTSGPVASNAVCFCSVSVQGLCPLVEAVSACRKAKEIQGRIRIEGVIKCCLLLLCGQRLWVSEG